MLENLNEKHPNMIINAQKPNLLAGAIVYVYLKNSGMNGRGGITAKSVGEYFSVKGSAITQKAFDVDFSLYGMKKYIDINEEYEYIDKDRFTVNELYFDFLESSQADDVKKNIKILQSIIKKDANYFDPYITLHEYYLMDGDFKKAMETIEKGFQKAIDLIDRDGQFPNKLRWGFIENRHIIRMLFNFAMFIWKKGDKEIALEIFLNLLKADHNDNVGARYSIVAILEGFDSQEEYEEQFESEMGLDYMKVEEWFHKSAMKHIDIIGWWLELEDE